MGAEAVIGLLLAGGLATKVAAGVAVVGLVATGAFAVERQFEVWKQQRAASRCQAQQASLANQVADLTARNAQLASANAAFTVQVARQDEKLSALSDETERRAEAARLLLAQQEQMAARERGAAQRMADALRTLQAQRTSGSPAPPCPAGEALGQVRAQLRPQ